MSTVKTTNLQHASAGSPAIVLDAAGDATYAGTHDFSAATVTGAGGLRLVTPTSIDNTGGSASATGGEVTFTGVTSVSLNGVFTSAYDNYRIMFNAERGTSGNTNLRLRASGTDDTGSNYVVGRYYVGVNISQAAGSQNNSTNADWDFLNCQSGTVSGCSVDLFSPQKSTTTAGNFISGGSFLDIFGYSHTQTTSYDGLTVFVTASNMTGTVRVYGYQNS